MEALPREQYLPRVVDGAIDEKLAYAGAVEIRGAKWCGKTETALQHAASSVMMQAPDTRAANKMLAESKPSVLLRGEKPLLIDEWQEAPVLWDAVRYAVDESRATGQYILTGSATPVARPSHSGAGRIVPIDMRPMTLSESGDSTSEVSLGALFDSPAAACEGHSESDVETMAFLACRGGWPRAAVTGMADAALEMAYDYVSTIAESDISRVDGVSRNPQYARLIMAEYARCCSTQASQSTMNKDLKARDVDLSKDTVNAYLGALRNLFVIEESSAWTPSLHARSRIAKTPTRYFACPSIAAASLGANPASLMRDLSTFGMLFESLCIRDLRTYAQAIKGEVHHYRDESGLEADAVVALRDGRYALMEMKLGTGDVDAGAATLLKLAGKVDTSVMGAPTFCAVVVPGGYAYRRSDGVLVIPISTLHA